MYISRWSFLTLFGLSLPSQSIPFTSRDSFWDQTQDRSVDRPVQEFNPRPEPFRRNARPVRKRSINYSVVQVDGSSTPVPPATVVQTITQTAKTKEPITETLSLTSTISEPLSIATNIITKVQEIVTTASSPLPPPSSMVETHDVVSVVTDSVLSTVTASPTSSTSYYDDGLWHTYYPVKNFQPDWSTTSSSTWHPTSRVSCSSSTTIYARAAIATDSSARQAWTATAPEAVWSPNSGPSSDLTERRVHDEREAVEDMQSGNLEPRRIPADLQVASWNMTEA